MSLLYLKHDNELITKKKKKKKKKKVPLWLTRNHLTRTISPPPPAIEISTPQEIIVTIPHPPLFPHHGYCLGVDVKPSFVLS